MKILYASHLLIRHPLQPTCALLRITLTRIVISRQFHNLLSISIHYPLFSHGYIILLGCRFQITYVRCNLFGTRPFLIHPRCKCSPENMQATLQFIQSCIAEYGSHPVFQIGGCVSTSCPCPDNQIIRFSCPV